MDATTPGTTSAEKTARLAPRGRNPRGQGERPSAVVFGVVLRLLDDLADDQALSLRAVAREAGIAATSVYIHFADRDTLVLATLEHCHTDLLTAAGPGGAGRRRPRGRAARPDGDCSACGPASTRGCTRCCTRAPSTSARTCPSRSEMAKRTIAAIRRCMDAGLAPRGDAETVATGSAHGRPRRGLAARQPARAALASAGGAGGPVPDEAGRCPGCAEPKGRP